MFLSKGKNKYIWLIAALLITVLAGLLRLYNISYMEFKHDEAANSYLAARFIYNGLFPKTGIMSSVNILNPPFFIYLLTIPFAVSRNPVIAAVFIALLNTAAVFFCFIFCRRFFNQRIGLIASLLLAVNPWAVMFSRKIWNQDVLTPFIILFLFSVYKVMFESKKDYIYLCIKTGTLMSTSLLI